MAWVAGIGYAVGVSAAATTTAYMVGGAIIGAAIGGLYSAVTGGDILKGVLYGAIGGAVAGYGIAAVTATGITTGAAGTGAGIGAGGFDATTAATIGTELSAGSGTGSVVGGLLDSKGAAVIGTGLTKWYESISDKAAAKEAGELKLKLQKRQLDAQIKMASAKGGGGGGSSGAVEAAKIRAGVDMASLGFQKDKFAQEFSEQKYRYRDEKDTAAKQRAEFQKSIFDAASVAKTEAKSAELVDSNRRRKDLPASTWKIAATEQAPQVTQPQTPIIQPPAAVG